MDENEKKIISPIFNDLGKLMNLLLSYLNFFSPNDEKINYPMYFNKYKSLFQIETNTDKINNEKLNEKVQIYFEEFNNEMLLLNGHLKEVNKYLENNLVSFTNSKYINELNNLYSDLKNLRSKNILYKSRIQNNELIYLIFKHIVNIIECSIVEDLLKSEIKGGYILRGKYKSFSQNNTIDIKQEVVNYIKNTLKCNIDFNYDLKGNISIKYFPFSIIIISSPLKENFYSLKRKLTLIINFINHKKENQDLILIDKIKTLFENRLASILNLLFEEKKLSIHKSVSFTQQNILEFIINFLNYLYNYNNLMKKKCALCNKISKYSFVEKSFFPPYYKLYKTYKIPIDNNFVFNEKENLFYHEDCFKKISNTSV